MKELIGNFVGSATVAVEAMPGKMLGNLVLINQHVGSMSFQHAMTPEQAREMAAALVAMAGSFDEVTA